MPTVYDRLQFNFDSAKFGTGNELTDGQKKSLTGQSILKTWQINNLADNSVSGYFKNPHTENLIILTDIVNDFINKSNTSNITFTFASDQANSLNLISTTLLSEIPNFKDHTDRMSGTTYSTDKQTTPDYQIAMQVGRQMLTITNQTDNIQNNSPILGNFTSLFIQNDLSNNITLLISNSITLNNSISLVDSNLTSNITSSSMNTIISNVQTTYNLLYGRRSSDITFYTNSLILLDNYQTLMQFNNLGVTSSYLIENYIGTTKLKTNLAS
jgi:uncharacterized protein YeaC (DUF1315 family)